MESNKKMWEVAWQNILEGMGLSKRHKGTLAKFFGDGVAPLKGWVGIFGQWGSTNFWVIWQTFSGGRVAIVLGGVRFENNAWAPNDFGGGVVKIFWGNGWQSFYSASPRKIVSFFR